MLLREVDLGVGRSGFVKLRENIGFDLRMAGRASAGSPAAEEIDRERSATMRTGEMAEHFSLRDYAEEKRLTTDCTDFTD
jgi:hypothetical protein